MCIDWVQHWITILNFVLAFMTKNKLTMQKMNWECSLLSLATCNSLVWLTEIQTLFFISPRHDLAITLFEISVKGNVYATIYFSNKNRFFLTSLPVLNMEHFYTLFLKLSFSYYVIKKLSNYFLGFLSVIYNLKEIKDWLSKIKWDRVI